MKQLEIFRFIYNFLIIILILIRFHLHIHIYIHIYQILENLKNLINNKKRMKMIIKSTCKQALEEKMK